MRINHERFLKFLAVLFLAQAASSARAVECTAPDAAKTTEVVTYLAKKYQLASTSSLVLTASARANDACFWKLEYAITAPKQSILLYLSPDRRYLSPVLYDVSLDPLSETREADAKLANDLLKGSNPALGPATAPVTIVEFSDFQCPYCKRMTDTLEKEVLPKEGGKVKVVFRNFPLPMHPWAKQAAEVAECAALQKPEAFWAMHDFLFQNQTTFTTDTFRDQIAKFASGRNDIDQTQFASCVDHELGLGPVTQDMQMGNALGVHGTPTLFINGVRFDGVHSADEMTQLIDKAVKGELYSPSGSLPAPNPGLAPRSAASASSGSAQCAPSGGTANAR